MVSRTLSRVVDRKLMHLLDVVGQGMTSVNDALRRHKVASEAA
jgi:hypothetical protein